MIQSVFKENMKNKSLTPSLVADLKAALKYDESNQKMNLENSTSSSIRQKRLMN
jgi:hypothetical protein